MDLAIVNKPLEYRDQRVITLDLIDQLHDRPKGTASRNFNENRHRFIEGEDYFHLSINEIRILNLPAKPKGLIVLTESGYLMLVKSFIDDKAWEVQKTLVKSYFRAKEILNSEGQFARMLRQNAATVEALLKKNASELKELSLFKETHQKLEKIESTVIDIKSRLPRREFSAKTKRLFQEVSLIKFGGRCLICPEIRVVDDAGNITDEGEYDHFYNHSENGHDQGWIISKKANRAMKDNRQKYRPEFEIFQRELSEYLNEKRLSSAWHSRGRSDKITVPIDQMSLF